MQVLLFLTMGMAEFGQYFYIKSAFQSAARDACRAAVIATAAQADPTTAATRTLGFANVTYNSSWMTVQDITTTPVTVTNCATVAAGHTIQVTIQVTYDQIPNVYRPLYQMTGQGIRNGKPMIGQCTMIRE